MRLAAACGLAVSLASARQTSFVTVDEAIRGGVGDRVVFFRLDESFADCLPLRAPCPATSSSLMLVPAAGRTVSWSPEGADLPRVDIEGVDVRPLGVAPPDPAGATYLVPTLDGAGTEVRFVATRLDGDRLSTMLDGTPAGDTVVPKLEGPQLSTSAPASRVPEAILTTPRVVDADELDVAVPTLLVRRAAPSRVVVGIAPAADWGMAARFVALLDDGVVARAARHDGAVGLAVPLTEEAAAPGSGRDVGDSGGAGADDAQSQGDDVGSTSADGNADGGASSGVAAAVSAALGAALAGVFLELRRRRRKRRSA